MSTWQRELWDVIVKERNATDDASVFVTVFVHLPCVPCGRIAIELHLDGSIFCNCHICRFLLPTYVFTHTHANKSYTHLSKRKLMRTCKSGRTGRKTHWNQDILQKPIAYIHVPLFVCMNRTWNPHRPFSRDHCEVIPLATLFRVVVCLLRDCYLLPHVPQFYSCTTRQRCLRRLPRVSGVYAGERSACVCDRVYARSQAIGMGCPAKFSQIHMWHVFQQLHAQDTVLDILPYRQYVSWRQRNHTQQ